MANHCCLLLTTMDKKCQMAYTFRPLDKGLSRSESKYKKFLAVFGPRCPRSDGGSEVLLEAVTTMASNSPTTWFRYVSWTAYRRAIKGEALNSWLSSCEGGRSSNLLTRSRVLEKERVLLTFAIHKFNRIKKVEKSGVSSPSKYERSKG